MTTTTMIRTTILSQTQEWVGGEDDNNTLNSGVGTKEESTKGKSADKVDTPQ